MDPEEFVGGVADELLCSVCTKVLLEPRSCLDGHTFCRSCIGTWMEQNASCPTCRTVLSAETLSHNRIAQNMIARLPARCPNYGAAREDSKRQKISPPVSPTSPTDDGSAAAAAAAAATGGCDWVGPHSERLAHANNVCRFQIVKCPHTGCGEPVQRRGLKEHQESCPSRAVKCSECGASVTSREMKRHQTTCSGVQITCPHKCGAQFKRGDAEQHELVCPNAPVECPVVGCTVRLLRKDLASHESSSSVLHVTLLTAHVQRLEGLLSSKKSPEIAEVNVAWTVEKLKAKVKDGKVFSSRHFRVGPVGALSETYMLKLTIEVADAEGNVGSDGEAKYLGIFPTHVDQAGDRLPLSLAGSRFAVTVPGRSGEVVAIKNCGADWKFDTPGTGWGWSKFLPLDSLGADSTNWPDLITVHATIRAKAPPVNQVLSI